MEDIKTYLRDNRSASITDVARAIERDRHVVSRDLHILEERGVVTHREHGPSTQWELTTNPLLSKIQQEDDLSHAIEHVFSNLPGTISVQDNTNTVRWSTSDGVGHHRNCHLFHRGKQHKCDNCPISTVKATKRPMSFTTEWGNEQKHITLIPVNDSIVEHIA